VFDEPLQFSAASHDPTDARQTVVPGCFTSAGQVKAVPLHFSSASQMPAIDRQTVVFGNAVQVPAEAPTLHAWQSVVSPLPHALLQQTPSTQKPELHQLVALHVWPGSRLSSQLPARQKNPPPH
jgi:hypothetical protein